jgi:hypothetical protein
MLIMQLKMKFIDASEEYEEKILNLSMDKIHLIVFKIEKIAAYL